MWLPVGIMPETGDSGRFGPPGVEAVPGDGDMAAHQGRCFYRLQVGVGIQAADDGMGGDQSP